MKKLIVFMIMGFAAVGFISAQVAKGGTLYVAVKTVTLKSSTGFFASNRGTLNYGDVVTVLQVSGKFVEVQSAANSSLTGWTALANLSVKQILLGNISSMSAKETALAGKGNLNYADVDKAETITVHEDADRVETTAEHETDILGLLEDDSLSKENNE